MIDAADNFLIRFLFNDWSLKTETPWVHGGCVGGDGGDSGCCCGAVAAAAPVAAMRAAAVAVLLTVGSGPSRLDDSGS